MCWVFRPKWDLYTNPCPRLQEHPERGQTEYESQKMGGELWRAVFWKWHGGCTHWLIAAMVTHSRSSQSKFQNGWGRDREASHSQQRNFWKLMAAGGGSHSPSSVPTWASITGLSKLLTKKEEEEIKEVGTGTLPRLEGILGGAGGK